MPKKISQEICKSICDLYNTPDKDGTFIGANIIANKLGVAQETVYNILRKNNIVVRSAKVAHSKGKRCKPIVNICPENEIPPLCKCGCNEPVRWNRRKNHWNMYISGHYRKDKPISIRISL